MSTAADSTVSLRETVVQLTELILALDRRLPQVERSGELPIVRAAAQLRTAAVERIGEIEKELARRQDAPHPVAERHV